MTAIRRQSTLATSVGTAGVELHGGAHTRLVLRPAPANTGIVFVRSDVTDRDNRVHADPASVVSTRNSTTLGNAAGVEVATVEHLMAALASVGLDNLEVELSGREIPALDGSAEPFLDMIDRAGIVPQSAPRRYVRVLRRVRVEDGHCYAEVSPSHRFELDVSIDFDDRAIGESRLEIAPDARSFRDDIGRARTFARMSDVRALKAAGLSKGGSLDNAVVVEDGRVLNPEGLRYSDEFVRHKVLDLMGDLYLGGPMVARVRTHCGGHALNHALMTALYADPDAWVFEGGPAVADAEPAPLAQTLAVPLLASA